jgi:hypothetical protein
MALLHGRTGRLNTKNGGFRPGQMSELTLPSLAEAQFEAGGAWTVATGTTEVLDMEKKTNFKNYDDMIGEESPGCLSTLRKMLQMGPVNRLVRALPGRLSGLSVP